MANIDKYISQNMLNLTDTYAVKILICYFLRQINRPITPDQLTEIATADGLLNYFTFMETLNQMLDTGMLTLEEKNGEMVYVLSEKSKAGADDFKKIVPKSFRDRILSSGLKFFAKIKNDRDVKVSITEQDRGYLVNCICKDGEILLLDLKLFAPDKDQANLLAEKIKLSPSDFYGKVLDFAIENEEYDPEPMEVDEL